MVVQDHISLYIQMELCKGMSLSQYTIDQQPCLSIPEVFLIFVQLVKGLSYIHSRDIVHRDLKPGNIFVNIDGMIKIGDFGLATIRTEKGLKVVRNQLNSRQSRRDLAKAFEKIQEGGGDSDCIGTPLYSAPEQDQGISYD